MSQEKSITLPFYVHLFILLLTLAAVTGWISNIITLFSLDTFSGEMVLRVVGIFLAPLGAVLGFL
jgi:type III secretory pathway component EscS